MSRSFHIHLKSDERFSFNMMYWRLGYLLDEIRADYALADSEFVIYAKNNALDRKKGASGRVGEWGETGFVFDDEWPEKELPLSQKSTTEDSLSSVN